jgi:hypothetical protein
MRYVAIGLALLFSVGCMTTRERTDKLEVQPTLVDPETAGTIDRNNDGIVSGAEIDTVISNPSTLTVFLWIVFAVILSVGITMILAKWYPSASAENKTDSTALLKARAAALDKVHKTTPPIYRSREFTNKKEEDEPKK